MVLCYKDMTFCKYYETCKDGKKCHKALTPEVRKKAREWWGKETAPISVFAEKPECYKGE